MLIAIDYDDTYTADPALWDVFIAVASSRGHEVICVTGRRASQPVGLELPTVYADGEYKREAAERAGYRVDVWIDDMPGYVERGRLLDWAA